MRKDYQKSVIRNSLGWKLSQEGRQLPHAEACDTEASWLQYLRDPMMQTVPGRGGVRSWFYRGQGWWQLSRPKNAWVVVQARWWGPWWAGVESKEAVERSSWGEEQHNSIYIMVSAVSSSHTPSLNWSVSPPLPRTSPAKWRTGVCLNGRDTLYSCPNVYHMFSYIFLLMNEILSVNSFINLIYIC